MSYLAIYRRFRPNDFSSVVGQEHVVTTLINQIKTERIGHAYLFCGARGTGKTTVARIFARAINCLNPKDGSPCGECEVCQKLSDQSNLDIIEIDAASNNKVDNVQEIRTNVQYPPVTCRYKVYIIDEVHMLTTEAFNALLKTLEEPPKHAVFILATTEPQKLPATILSRCMRFDFHLVSDKVIQQLIEKIYDEVGKSYEKSATALIARSGEGSIRDALSLADLCLSYGNEKLTYKQVIDILGASDSSKTAKLLDYILRSDVGGVLSVIDELNGLGKSISVLTKDVLSMIRDVLVVKTCKGAKDILMLPDAEYDRLYELSDLADNHRFLRILEIFTAIETDLRYSTHPRIVFEAAAVKATLPPEDYNVDALISRVSALEKTLESILKGGTVIAQATSQAAVKRQESQTEDENNLKQAEIKNEQKSAYKPVIDTIDENLTIKNTQTQKIADEQTPAFKKTDTIEFGKANANEAVKANVPKSDRLEAFDYISDEDAPPEDFSPVEGQIGFDGAETLYKATPTQTPMQSNTQTPMQSNTQSNTQARDTMFGDNHYETAKSADSGSFEGYKEASSLAKPSPTVEGAVVRDRISDARLWGTVIRKLRSEKHIMLWIACQELDAKIEDGKLKILAEGENEYNLLIKPENVQILQGIVSNLAPYRVVIESPLKSSSDADDFKKDAETVNEMFDGKLQIKE